MSDFKLKSVKYSRGRQFEVTYQTPDGQAITESVIPSQLRTQLSFWQDRAGSVTFSEGGDPEPEADTDTARAQFDQTAQAESQESARVAFLVGVFPTWPARRDELVEFAKRAGIDLVEVSGASDEAIWEKIFGEVPPTNLV